MRELVIPPVAETDENSIEILRAWAAGGAQWLSLNPHLYRNRDFEEEWAWGLFLSDTIKHIANAMHEQTGKDQDEIVKAIRQSFEAEIGKPTSEVRGGYLDTHKDA
ncbi:MAG: DUF5076 domain-containing protein [Gammaproteobacteria bacterium]|nr:DUF5076 domain-containing protein [Gammaproteobacteria bacterium]